MQRRRELMGMQTDGLPGAYQRIEYLESNGTQYLATNYIPTANETTVDITYQATVRYSSDDMMLGISNNTVSFYAEEYNTNRWYAAVGLSRYQNIQWREYGNNLYKTNAVIGLDKITVTNLETEQVHEALPNGAYSQFDNVLPLFIFAWNEKGNARYLHRGIRIYALKLYRSGSISANFIPCIRKFDSKPGMYDTVSKTFFTNAGTGEFIIPA